ncbi:MAG: beta-lactamase family protein [Asgard group archaeon]|nr:beta-lactamase family protein [Asgard group archaeon]
MKKKILALTLMAIFILTPFLYITITNHKALFHPTKLEQSTSINDFKEQLELKWENLLKTYSIPGGAISIIHESTTTTLVTGKANYWKNDPLTSDDYFQIASISKTQCAFAIMKLVQDGLLDLDVPVSTYLTRWSLPDNGFDNNGVTIRRILCHAAGLSLSGVPGQLNLDTLPSIEEALTDADVKVITEPASTYIYSGGGYGILQLIIEEVTGLDYQDYLQTVILQPLGLTNTFAGWDESIRSNFAKGYGNLFLPAVLSYTPFKSAGGHYSTIEDMTNWCELFIYGQSLLNETTFNNMLTSQFGSDWGYTLGFNWRKLENGQVTVGHGGDNWGYHSLFRFSNETDDGIVILTNGDRGIKLINILLNEWERLLGGVDNQDYFTQERNINLAIAIVIVVLTIILKILLILGNRFSLVVFTFQNKANSVEITKPKLVKGLRWSTSIIFALLTVFLIFQFGLFYNSYSSKPTNFIWVILLILEWCFWIIPASHFIIFNLRQLKTDNFQQTKNQK